MGIGPEHTTESAICVAVLSSDAKFSLVVSDCRKRTSFTPVWIIILENLRLAISFKWDSMSFALAPDIQLTVCDGVASLICLRVESPITRTLSSASVILIVEKRFEIEMGCECDTDID